MKDKNRMGWRKRLRFSKVTTHRHQIIASLRPLISVAQKLNKYQSETFFKAVVGVLILIVQF